MVKNGLFICSIGLLIFLYSLNPNSSHFDILSMVTGIFLIILGILVFLKGDKKENQRNKNDKTKKRE